MSCGKDENKNKKRPGLAHFLKKTYETFCKHQFRKFAPSDAPKVVEQKSVVFDYDKKLNLFNAHTNDNQTTRRDRKNDFLTFSGPNQ